MNILYLIDFLNTNFTDLIWQEIIDYKKGFLSTNSCFSLAKEYKISPQELANKKSKEINEFFKLNIFFLKANSLNGYINIDFNNYDFKDFDILNLAKLFELKKVNKRILIDYLSINLGKKAHLGHMCSANLGESLKRILSLKYTEVVSENYLGNWGIQFCLLIWSFNHFEKLKLDFVKPNLLEIDAKNLSKKENLDLIDKLYRMYVKVNYLAKEDDTITQEVKKIQKQIELDYLAFTVEKKDKTELIKLWLQIVDISLMYQKEIENFLNLNTKPNSHILLKNSDYYKNYNQKNLDLKTKNQLLKLDSQAKFNFSPILSEFDFTLGESFFVSLIPEVYYLAQKKVFIQEGEAIFIDLEEEKLGRCYLISSDGYSSYATRDILARFVWSGVLNSEIMITASDNRQSHHFRQVFAIIKRIIKSKIYTKKEFGWLTEKQTKKALKILSNTDSLKHIGFGFLSLPDGTMSTRKGKILAFEDVKNKLLEEIELVGIEKKLSLDTETKIKLAKSTIKWLNLSKDREIDTIFDIKKLLKFEGNTGIYQLYTIARINSILDKNYKNEDLNIFNQKNVDFSILTEKEILIFKHIYILPLILENICKNYKPHLLINFLYYLSTEFNSWYSNSTSIILEKDLTKKNTLLKFCLIIRETLEFGLNLLAIDSVKKI